jgi:phosphatidylserine decarboxylase
MALPAGSRFRSASERQTGWRSCRAWRKGTQSSSSRRRALPTPIREGWALLAPPALASLLLLRPSPAGAAVAAASAAFVAWFLRDPDRTPTSHGLALAPADGRVVRIAPVHDDYLDAEMIEVSIFLALWNVHVQRAPLAGRVIDAVVVSGPRRPAMFDDAAHNHRHCVYMETAWGPCVVTLMAGLLARRIVRWVEPGDDLAAGDRLGIIKFGSRVSLRLPVGCRALVEVGQEVRGGLTPVASPP